MEFEATSKLEAKPRVGEVQGNFSLLGLYIEIKAYIMQRYILKHKSAKFSNLLRCVFRCVMMQLEALMPKAVRESSESANERRREGGREQGREEKSRRRRSRSRSRSRGRHHRHRSRDRSHSRSRSRSPDTETGRRRSSKWDQPERLLQPVVSQVYDGKVSSIMQFGCFVQLEGVRGRHEGLVHISQLRREGRIKDVSEVIKRGQRVKVKVLSITGSKMSLSMKVS